MLLRVTLVALLAAATLTQGRGAAADDFKLDESHTSIIFGISHMGLSYTYGRFNKAAGTYTLEAGDPSASKFKFTIDASSIDTANANRDNHLRSADFLNTGEFPLITFESNKVATKQDGEKLVYIVTGNMTMHGVTREIELNLIKLGEGSGPRGGDFRTGFLCDVKLLRSEFGMTNNLPGVGDEVAITISFEGVRQ